MKGYKEGGGRRRVIKGCGESEGVSLGLETPSLKGASCDVQASVITHCTARPTKRTTRDRSTRGLSGGYSCRITEMCFALLLDL